MCFPPSFYWVVDIKISKNHKISPLTNSVHAVVILFLDTICAKLVSEVAVSSEWFSGLKYSGLKVVYNKSQML